MALAAHRLDHAVWYWSRSVGGETAGIVAGEELIARFCVFDAEGKADEGINIGAGVL
jgi:hypothetical protein